MDARIPRKILISSCSSLTRPNKRRSLGINRPGWAGLKNPVSVMPRLLNILAHKSLLAVFGEGKHSVRAQHVRQAAADTEGAGSAGWW